MKPFAMLFLTAALFAACNASAQPPEAAPAPAPASATVMAQNAPLPEGGSCTSDIARYRAIQEQDITMGHVAKSVYNKIKVEIAAAEAECNAGHEAHAIRHLVDLDAHRHPLRKAHPREDWIDLGQARCSSRGVRDRDAAGNAGHMTMQQFAVTHQLDRRPISGMDPVESRFLKIPVHPK